MLIDDDAMLTKSMRLYLERKFPNLFIDCYDNTVDAMERLLSAEEGNMPYHVVVCDMDIGEVEDGKKMEIWMSVNNISAVFRIMSAHDYSSIDYPDYFKKPIEFEPFYKFLSASIMGANMAPQFDIIERMQRTTQLINETYEKLSGELILNGLRTS